MAHTTTFLLVEDDPSNVFFVEQHFKKAPVHIRLRCVSDGAEAIDYLKSVGKYADREQYPLPDVILLDLKMPRLDGFDFLQWRQKAGKPYCIIPVVVMSSSALQEDVDRAYSLGANSYMVKPVKWTEFAERVVALGVYWSEHVETPEHPSQT